MSRPLLKRRSIESYKPPDQRHHDKPLAQWLVDLATEFEVCGVTMEFVAEHSGQHHRPHSGHFPKLVDQTVGILITACAEKTQQLFERLNAENVHLFYIKAAVEFGMLGEPA